jgi:hypothetical protein
MRFIQNGHAAGCLATLLAAGAMVHGLAQAQAQPANAIPFDTAVTIEGVETVCTGIGVEARGEPRWNAYPLKVELVGRGAQYLGDVHIAVTKDEKRVLEVDCGGPWVLFKLPAARYQLHATIEGHTVSSSAYVPATGQGRIILRFPQLGGALESLLNTGPYQGGVSLAARTD